VFYSPAGGGVACSPCSTTALTMKNNIIWSPGTISTGGALSAALPSTKEPVPQLGAVDIAAFKMP
jgi:hypothetical protein